MYYEVDSDCLLWYISYKLWFRYVYVNDMVPCVGVFFMKLIVSEEIWLTSQTKNRNIVTRFSTLSQTMNQILIVVPNRGILGYLKW
jgi:hypothetical protein